MSDTKDELVDNNDRTHDSNRSVIIILSVVSLVLAVLMVTTQPTSGGPRVILLALGLVFVILNCLCLLIMRTIGLLKVGKLQLQHEKLTALLASVAAIFILGLNTLNQAGVIDVLLATMFVALVYFYIIRRF